MAGNADPLGLFLEAGTPVAAPPSGPASEWIFHPDYNAELEVVVFRVCSSLIIDCLRLISYFKHGNTLYKISRAVWAQCGALNIVTSLPPNDCYQGSKSQPVNVSGLMSCKKWEALLGWLYDR
jgi:hypothetical protein